MLYFNYFDFNTCTYVYSYYPSKNIIGKFNFKHLDRYDKWCVDMFIYGDEYEKILYSEQSPDSLIEMLTRYYKQYGVYRK